MPARAPFDAVSPLVTDLYQLTMAYAAWRAGRSEHEAAFSAYFRTAPFAGGYTIAAGVEAVADFLEHYRFTADDCAFLATLTGADGAPLFSEPFLHYLADLRLTLDVDMVAEGRVVFPNEPLVRVVGPLAQAQLVETTLLSLVGFPSLVATKAARVCLAAQGDEVLEFGLRRAQGPDAGTLASRSAYLGGVAATSNVFAGQRYGIPVRGTHAHSWVMAFGTEIEAFDAYANALPNNAVFLVDTYDTLEGVRHAIAVGERLRARGQRLLGVRLDSGDLAYLSIEARKLLDAAGFPDAQIVGSNDLDEHLIESLKRQGARIGVWGVGTKLATAADTPALGVVYKLTAIRNPIGEWEPRIKVSEQTAKTTTPGILQVRRFSVDGDFAGDMIFDEAGPPGEGAPTMVDPLDPTRRKRFDASATSTDLLEPVFRQGARVRPPEALAASRARAAQDLAGFHAGVKRLANPHRYPVGLEQTLHERRTALVLAARGFTTSDAPPAGWDVAAD